jgi:hypothetical protein
LASLADFLFQLLFDVGSCDGAGLEAQALAPLLNGGGQYQRRALNRPEGGLRVVMTLPLTTFQ